MEARFSKRRRGWEERARLRSCDRCWIIEVMVGGRHQRTLEAIFAEPVQAGIAWRDVEAMFLAFSAEVSEGHGSRVRVALNGVRAVFHRPHPRKEIDKGAVISVRRFLKAAGVSP
ncbi:type II toxin-antitoxin system HicA family toxin [Jiella sp. M17.18]|uniref:type II toxin-antitoxin system HicA family toxin n=1 Tax=Jiella sp. M17.18 TaxID=3234247 RepID=UPI0034E02330